MDRNNGAPPPPLPPYDHLDDMEDIVDDFIAYCLTQVGDDQDAPIPTDQHIYNQNESATLESQQHGYSQGAGPSHALVGASHSIVLANGSANMLGVRPMTVFGGGGGGSGVIQQGMMIPASSQSAGPSEPANGRYVDGASELGMVLDDDVVIAANQASTLTTDIYNQHQNEYASLEMEQLGSSHGAGSSQGSTGPSHGTSGLTQVGASISQAQRTQKSPLTPLKVKPHMFKKREDAAAALKVHPVTLSKALHRFGWPKWIGEDGTHPMIQISARINDGHPRLFEIPRETNLQELTETLYQRFNMAPESFNLQYKFFEHYVPLSSLDSPVNDENVVHYALEGLPEKYNQVCGYMHYKDTFPDLKTVCSLLITEEMRLKSKALALPVNSSSPMVLMALPILLTRRKKSSFLGCYEQSMMANVHFLVEVSNTLIKKVNGDGSASTVPREIVKLPTVSLEVEKGQSSDMLRDLESNYERRIIELKEDHARQLEAMQQKNDDDREKLIEDVVRKILGKLPPEHKNMNPIATQQTALNNALVPYEKRLKIEKCNARIAFSKPQRKETYQVTLEALKLSLAIPHL
ncbi:hypothetical protein Tco_0092865 [Tanacetum coccineum]